MKTQSTAAIQRRFTRAHWFMTILGIVTATACSLVFIKEMGTKGDNKKQSRFVQPSVTVVSEHVASRIQAKIISAIFHN